MAAVMYVIDKRGVIENRPILALDTHGLSIIAWSKPSDQEHKFSQYCFKTSWSLLCAIETTI